MILRPDDVLFAEVRDNDVSYGAAQRYWAETFERALGAEAAGWVSWMADPLSDGMPIFSRRHPGRRKGVAVQQIAPDDGEVLFRCWLNDFADEGEPPFPYLVIHTVAHRQARERFEILAELFAVRNADPEHLDRVMKDMMAADSCEAVAAP